MAQEKGIRITCARCKDNVFVKFKGMEPQEWSSPKEVYEQPPDGWTQDICLGQRIDLCPSCAKIFTAVQTEFMRN